MNGMLKWFLDSGLMQAQVSKAIKWAATVTAGAVMTMMLHLLQSHGFDVSGDLQNHITAVGSGVAGLVTAVLTLLWSLKDAKRVDVAIKASAIAGEPVSTSQAKAITKGQAITLPSGKTVVFGKPSPAGQTDPQERSETSALNRSQS